MNKFRFKLMKEFFRERLGISEHRQFQILETALTLIQKDGFEQLTFGALAKKCDISRSLVHHYFSDKYVLATKLLEYSTLHLQAYVQEVLQNEKDPQKHFVAYCQATLNWPVHNHDLAVGFFLFIYLSSHNHEMRRRNDELSTAGREKIKLLLTQAGLAGANLENKAESIQAHLSGAFLILLSENHTKKESLKLRQNCLRTCILLASS